MKKINHFKIPWNLIIPIIVIGILSYIFRAWLHDLIIYFYTNPLVIQFILIWLILHIFFLRKQKKRITILTIEGREENMPQINFFSYSILFFLFVVSGSISGILPQLHISNELNPNIIEFLPETSEEVRLMPIEVAQRFSRDSLQLSQFRLGSENIALVNGSLSWSFPLVPDGGILTYILKNKGIVYVDATTQERTSKIVFEDFQIGEGMQIFDNLYWGVYNNHYLINLDNPYYTLTPDGKIITVLSVIEYEFHQSFGLVYTVPRFGGVILIDNEGNIDRLTPKESLENPLLENNRLFPENLARYYIETLKFEKGIINRYFIHEDQIEIRDVSYRNRQPFLMDTKDGLKWFISAEPASASRGIFKIFLIDARTGEIENKELNIDETLTGPIKSRDFVRRSNPLVDWTAFTIVEPLPFVKEGILFWKVVVIPNDAAGIAFQAFVNSKTNDVVSLKTNEEIIGFVLDKNVPPINLTENVIQNKTNENIVLEIKMKINEIENLINKL